MFSDKNGMINSRDLITLYMDTDVISMFAMYHIV